jgi:hypothetical protein
LSPANASFVTKVGDLCLLFRLMWPKTALHVETNYNPGTKIEAAQSLAQQEHLLS